jgi:hypothetical protein
MDDSSTYDVRVYRTDVFKGAEVATYRVRWKTGHRHWREGFRNAALAGSFRSSLMTAAGKGETFSLSTGRPMSWQRAGLDPSGFEVGRPAAGAPRSISRPGPARWTRSTHRMTNHCCEAVARPSLDARRLQSQTVMTLSLHRC